MNVVATISFNKDVARIKDKQLANRVEKVLRKLEQADSIFNFPNVKRLSGASNAYRIRIGNYRIGFYFQENTVRLTVFADRKDIYKSFP